MQLASNGANTQVVVSPCVLYWLSSLCADELFIFLTIPFPGNLSSVVIFCLFAAQVEVTVSRFRLHIRVLMTLIKDRNMVRFALDPDCTKAGRAVLREATGFFFVESPPDRPEYSRVWMLATIDVNRFVPGAIVDYAASRALPRASNWIKPTCEMAQRRKVRESMGKGVSGQ